MLAWRDFPRAEALLTFQQVGDRWVQSSLVEQMQSINRVSFGAVAIDGDTAVASTWTLFRGKGAVYVYRPFEPVPGLSLKVYGNGQLIPHGSTNPIPANGTDFGAVNVTNHMVTNAFTITNTGTVSIQLAGPLIDNKERQARPFSVVSPPQTPLAPGASTTFAIEFNPNFMTNRHAQVTIGTENSFSYVYTFSIFGRSLVLAPPGMEAYVKPDDSSHADAFGTATAIDGDWAAVSRLGGIRLFPPHTPEVTPN